jgi:hypothetical protein
VLNEREIVGEARDQVPGRLTRQAGVVRGDQMREGRLLDVGRHAHHDAGARHVMQIEQNAARGRDSDDRGQDQRQHVGVVPHQHRIEGVLDDERVAAGRRCQA